MGLFKKMTDPSPGGGLTGDDPEAARRVNDSRDMVKLPKGGPTADRAVRVADPTALIMGGVRATGTIEKIARATEQINLQPTFEVELRVVTEGGEFTAKVIQPVAEEYLAAAEVGMEVVLKYMSDDKSQVWIDWAASAAADS